MSDDVLVLSREGDDRIERVAAPDARWWALLDEVRWGTNGLRFRVRDVPHLFEGWGPDTAYLQLVHGDELRAVFLLSPHTYTVDGFSFRAWYRTMLAVRDGTAGKGIGAQIALAARRHFLDEATEPTMLYGFIENANERSMRLQLKLGYTSIAEFECTMLGWLFPRDREGVDAATEADLPALRALWDRARQGHVLDDLDASLRLGALRVLRRDGRPVAVAQISAKKMDVEQLPGLDGWLLLRMSPLTRLVSPFFSVRPHRALWLGNAAWERPDDWLALAEALQHREQAGSLLWYSQRESAARQALGAMGLGAVHKLSPNPTLQILAGWKHIPDEVIATIRKRPLWFSPSDAN